MISVSDSVSKRVLTVSDVTRQIKNLVQQQFSSLWIRGEISNFKSYASGHFYFTLKDRDAQMPAVMFKGHQRSLKFRPEDGMGIIAHGRLDVYEVQGRYQMLVDHLEPDGVGALQFAFEQLKKKLQGEGLFDSVRKRPLPFLPRTVGLVTSAHGAAVRDMVSVLTRRFPAVNILLYPVKVQGEGAREEIARGLDYFSETGNADVVIVGRGGGSIEDLWAFNEEIVARAVARSRIPVLSAVGHETDFTICDFVADLRAPTPSAAAELCVPNALELRARLDGLRAREAAAINRILKVFLRHLDDLRRRIPRPDELWDRSRQKLGDLEDALYQKTTLFLRDQNIRLAGVRFKMISPRELINENRNRLGLLRPGLLRQIEKMMTDCRHRLERDTLKLDLLSPRNVLKRGYVISRRPDGSVVTRKSQIVASETLNLTFFDGELLVTSKG